MVFYMQKEIMKTENIQYTNNRNYDAPIGLKAIAYYFMVISNIMSGDYNKRSMKSDLITTVNYQI